MFSELRMESTPKNCNIR